MGTEMKYFATAILFTFSVSLAPVGTAFDIPFTCPSVDKTPTCQLPGELVEHQYKRPTVLLVPVDSKLGNDNKFADLVLSSSLKTLVGQAGAELIDRKLAEELRDEFARCEAKGNICLRLKDAEFVLKAELHPSTTAANYIAKRETTDKEGNTTVHPAQCIYTAKAKGQVTVYELANGMKPLSIVAISGDKSSYEQTDSTSCSFSHDRLQSMVTSAVEEAVELSRGSISSHFAPTGYVTEYRCVEKKPKCNYIGMSVGENEGARKKQTVSFYKLPEKHKKNSKPIITADQESMVTGKVVSVEQMGKGKSWVKIKDRNALEKISLGDIGKFKNPNPCEGKYALLNAACKAIK